MEYVNYYVYVNDSQKRVVIMVIVRREEDLYADHYSVSKTGTAKTIFNKNKLRNKSKRVK